MSDITVIGTGIMGSTLARALLSNGFDVTVWNRTRSKALPLADDGAMLAADLAQAVQASPAIMMCVTDYPATQAVFSDDHARGHLAGRTLLQMTSGTPRDATESARWAERHGADYVDCAIVVYPEQIGTPEGAIMVSGPETAFRAHEHLLQALAGDLVYAGDAPGAANAHGMASGAVFGAALLGALQAALMCEAAGLDVGIFAQRMRSADMATVASMVDDLLTRIHEERYGDSRATLATGAAGIAQVLQHARDAQIYDDVAALVDQVFRMGMDAGLGDQDPAALIKVLREAG